MRLLERRLLHSRVAAQAASGGTTAAVRPRGRIAVIADGVARVARARQLTS
jgi:apolipoprotein N-acyltransferase